MANTVPIGYTGLYHAALPQEEAPVSDTVSRIIARALAEELIGNSRFVEALAEAIVDRLLRHKGADFTGTDLKDTTDGVLPEPVVLPGVVPAEVPPEPAMLEVTFDEPVAPVEPVSYPGPVPLPLEVPPAAAGTSKGQVRKGSPAYRVRKAWTQKNYYRRQKGLAELPRPASWDAPEKKEDKPEDSPKTEDG